MHVFHVDLANFIKDKKQQHHQTLGHFPLPEEASQLKDLSPCTFMHDVESK